MLPLTNIKGTNLWAIEVPVDATNIALREYLDIDNHELSYSGGNKTNRIAIPTEHQLVIIGTVSKDNIEFNNERVAFFVQGYGGDSQVRKVLLDNGIYFENPLGKNEPDSAVWLDRHVAELEDKQLAWQTAESKTIKGLLVIIKSVK